MTPLTWGNAPIETLVHRVGRVRMGATTEVAPAVREHPEAVADVTEGRRQ